LSKLTSTTEAKAVVDVRTARASNFWIFFILILLFRIKRLRQVTNRLYVKGVNKMLITSNKSNNTSTINLVMFLITNKMINTCNNCYYILAYLINSKI
jgi:hypothetical protein